MKQDQFSSTRVQFAHSNKLCTVQVIEHFHNSPFPKDLDQVTQFIKNYKPQILENYEELQNDTQFAIQFDIDQLFFGLIENGLKKGVGVYYKSEKYIFEGDWQDNQKNGRGIELFYNGSYYEGQYKNGKPSGMGRFQWSNGEYYEGQWFNGKKHGSGIAQCDIILYLQDFQVNFFCFLLILLIFQRNKIKLVSPSLTLQEFICTQKIL